MQAMETELRARPNEDGLAAVKNAQTAHEAGLLEVRGKITRADAFLARLASDLKHNSDTLQSLMEHQQHYHAKVSDNLGLMDAKVSLKLLHAFMEIKKQFNCEVLLFRLLCL
jgi:hypothetical protein